MNQQEVLATKMAKSILGYVRKGLATRPKGDGFFPYSALVRQHLEHSAQFSASWYKSDRDILDRVQQGATRMT